MTACTWADPDGEMCGGLLAPHRYDPDVTTCVHCGATYHRSPASRTTLPAPGYTARLAADMMDVRDPRDP
jgi:hypothetical protein